jgi:hypothetical protein
LGLSRSGPHLLRLRLAAGHRKFTMETSPAGHSALRAHDARSACARSRRSGSRSEGFGGDRYGRSRDYGRSRSSYGGSSGGGTGWNRSYGGDYGSGWNRDANARGDWDYDRRNWSDRDYGRGYGGEERGFWDRASDEVSSWFGDEEAARRRQEDQRGRRPRNYIRSGDRFARM